MRGSSTAQLAVFDLQAAFRRPGQWHVPRYDEAAARIGRLIAAVGESLFTRFVPDPSEQTSWRAYYDRWDQLRLPPEDSAWDVDLPGYDGGATLDLPTFGTWVPAMAQQVSVGGEFVLTGVASDCCVLSTALAAADPGRFVTVVTDACAGQDDAAQEGAVAMMGLLTPMIRLVNCDGLLVERSGASETPYLDCLWEKCPRTRSLWTAEAGIPWTIYSSLMDLIGFWNDGAWPLLEGVSSLGPLATFVVALAAWRTYRQKAKADLRDQGWKRAEWAIGWALREDRESRLAGMVAISELSAGSVVTKEDKRLFGSVSTSVQGEVRKKVAEAPRSLRRGRRRGKAGP